MQGAGEKGARPSASARGHYKHRVKDGQELPRESKAQFDHFRWVDAVWVEHRGRIPLEQPGDIVRAMFGATFRR